MDLRPDELRVAGCLIEKALSTPAYYPLTLNALVNACNQSSNRDPVVSYNEPVVEEALTSLRERGLARIVYSTSNRAAKYKHVFDERWQLEVDELAVLAELLLRGPQTPGELRARCERMHPFASVADVEDVLDRLAGRPDPLVERLARQPGKREARTAHRLAGTGGPVAGEALSSPTAAGDAAPMDTATRAALLDEYRAGYQVVVDALAAVGDDLDASPADGGWTPRQVVHHLADSEMTSAIRLRRLLAEDRPAIAAYDEAEFARRLHYDRPIEASLLAFRAAREANASLLAALTEDEWARTGTHSESGFYSVSTWLEVYAVHGRDHADQIRSALAR